MNGQPERLLLDTNAVISLLRGEQTLLRVAGEAQWVGISIITELEFLAFPRLSTEDAQLFSEFLGRVAIVDLAHESTQLRDHIIALRRDCGLRLPDAIVAASALVHDAHLVTADHQLLALVQRVETLRVLAFEP